MITELTPRRPPVAGLFLALLVLLGAGCRQKMADQPRYDPLEASDFFEDGRSARPPVPGTVARGQLRLDDHFYTGRIGEDLVTELPFPVTAEMLARGRERYEIFCSPCHDRTGYGQGMVVRRGLRAPPSFHTARLRGMPVGHFFDVMTNGLGAMKDYAAQVPVTDRWAIAAYLRALQLSQYAPLEAAPPQEQEQLLSAPDQEKGTP